MADAKRLLEVRLALKRAYRKKTQHPVLVKARKMLHRYFQEGKPLGTIALGWARQSPFEKRVLRCVRRIPFGEVRSYRWLAKQIRLPGGARSCGQALRRNRFPLFIPCHRVVRSSGRLGGFSCGVRIKERLLSHERLFSKRGNP